jgi:uncharacterized protein (TIGR03437 family)
MQFDLEYDLASVELIATIGDAARFAQKALYFADVSATRRRFIIYGLNQTPILAGSLIDFTVGTAPDATQKVYPVNISNVTISTRDGFPATSSIVNGGIIVTPGTGSRLSTGSVRNAASLRAGPVAPGAVVTLFGTGIGPTTAVLPEAGVSSAALGGTSVWFGGLQAPLLYADQSQISAVVPFAVTGDTLDVQVQKNGAVWGTAQLALQAAAPSIFTLNWSGAGPGAIINEDGMINDLAHPARRESIVSIFATGAGQMDPAGVDGGIAIGTGQVPRLPVGITVGGVEAEVMYAGAAPSLIEGIVQVSARIPANAPVGPSVEICLVVGKISSPAGVTLVVR